jgi:RNA polymerase sigma factor (TIGR02999 family)
MRQIPPGQTLDPTALVHEAWVRISGRRPEGWSGRAEFFHAAARAMRDILVEDARRKGSLKRGGDRQRVVLNEQQAFSIEAPSDDVIALDESIALLSEAYPDAGRVVSLRYFTGLTIQEVAEVEGVSVSTVERSWRFARAWLRDHLKGGSADG